MLSYSEGERGTKYKKLNQPKKKQVLATVHSKFSDPDKDG